MRREWGLGLQKYAHVSLVPRKRLPTITTLFKMCRKALKLCVNISLQSTLPSTSHSDPKPKVTQITRLTWSKVGYLWVFYFVRTTQDEWKAFTKMACLLTICKWVTQISFPSGIVFYLLRNTASLRYPFLYEYPVLGSIISHVWFFVYGMWKPVVRYYSDRNHITRKRTGCLRVFFSRLLSNSCAQWNE